MAKILPAKSRFHLETEDEMEIEPTVEWLIPDLLPAKSTIMLVGRTQSYKSYLALDMALRVSQTAPVVYAGLEGMRTIRGSRRKAWKRKHGVDRLPNFYTARAPMAAIQDQIIEFGQQLEELPQKPALIVIDTLAKFAGGLDINSHKDASYVIRMAESYRDTFGCSVMLIHHEGKDEGKGAMGSMALHNDIDCYLRCKAHREHRLVELSVVKFKDAPEPEESIVYEGETIEGIRDLVFTQVDRSVLAKALSDDSPFTPSAVGAVLRDLGAVCGLTVKTAVLASEMASRLPNGDVATLEKERNKIARQLKRTAALAPYRVEDEWGLP